MGTEAHNATELVGFLLQEWVNSEPALQVDQFELKVGTRCPVLIPSLKLKVRYLAVVNTVALFLGHVTSAHYVIMYPK